MSMKVLTVSRSCQWRMLKTVLQPGRRKHGD